MSHLQTKDITSNYILQGSSQMYDQWQVIYQF